MRAICLNKHLDEESHPFLLPGGIRLLSPPPALLLPIPGVGGRSRNDFRRRQFEILKAMNHGDALKLHCMKNIILILLPSCWPEIFAEGCHHFFSIWRV